VIRKRRRRLHPALGPRNDEGPPRQIGRPEPGYYKRRLVGGGPWVSVRFYLEDGEMRVEVDGQTHRGDGERHDPHEVWPLSWPSTEQEYTFLCQLREWAQRFAPHHPAARPRERINLGELPPRTRP
jgi:hypothetical protein